MSHKLDMVVNTCNPALWRWKREDQKFKAIPCHMVNLRPAWDIGDPVSKTEVMNDSKRVAVVAASEAQAPSGQ